MKKIIFALPILIVLIILFYPYSLKKDYKKALNCCTQQNPSARGEFDGCMEEYLIQKNRNNYEKYRKTKNFCDFLYDSEYDKEQCIDRIIF